jgi:NADPH:quinone reductase-like Zn-dependent oxidoreductase
MKAAVYTKTISGKVLEIRDLPQPAPRDNEVLIRVRAASVNPLDWRLKNKRPGVDLAGEVVSVGAKVTRLTPGDAVFGTGKGAFAEYACASEAHVVVKPQSLSFELAAAVPIAGLTALQGLRDKGRLQSGQKVLINGAAGGVGTFAVQIAKLFGADVTAVCSTKNVERVQSLGAGRVIDYTTHDFTEDSSRYDLLLDNVGNRPTSSMRRILTPNGRCLIVGVQKKLSSVMTRLLETFIRGVILRQNFTFFIARINKEDLTILGELISAGKINPAIDRNYSLTETAAALAYVEDGHARAKVIITTE